MTWIENLLMKTRLQCIINANGDQHDVAVILLVADSVHANQTMH